MKKFVCERISQLEASKLNNECYQIIVQNAIKGFEFFNQQKISKIQPEITLVIDYIFYRLTIAINGNLPGNEIQNIKFPNITKKQKLLYFLINVVIKYLFNRMKMHFLYNQNSLKNLQKLIEYAEKLYNLFEFINFISFLYNGQYSSLILRIIGIKLTNIQDKAIRSLDFELLNRTIIWNSLSEFFLFFFPFIQSTLSKQFKNLIMMSSFLGAINIDEEDYNKCQICNDEMISMTRKLQCGHLFCYYCLQNYIDKNQQQLSCPKCNQLFNKEEIQNLNK